MDEQYAKVGHLHIRVIEECSELIHILCKVERFGFFNFHPNYPGRTNLQLVRDEIGDVKRMLEELEGEMNRLEGD